MAITIDGRRADITDADKTIVELASRAGVNIPAPCYRAERKNGCCNACVVEIDGKREFACSTTPMDGMDIVVDRADLRALRKERLEEYREGVKSGSPCGCSCSGSTDCC